MRKFGQARIRKGGGGQVSHNRVISTRLVLGIEQCIIEMAWNIYHNYEYKCRYRYGMNLFLSGPQKIQNMWPSYFDNIGLV